MLLEVNSRAGIPVEGSGFRGKLLFLQLPDPRPDDDAWNYGWYFARRKRRFEFRLQGTFEADPGEAFFSFYTPEHIGWSFFGQLTMQPIKAFFCALNDALGTGLFLNLEIAPQPDGGVERPCLCWPLLGADTVVVTPAGEDPPSLTAALDQLDLPRSQRSTLQLCAGCTYTFAFHSMYVDFERWEVCSPVGPTISLESLLGSRPLFLSVYRLLQSSAADGGISLHAESNKRYIFSAALENLRVKAAIDGC